MIKPFERSQKPADRKVVGKGEGHREPFIESIHDAINNSKPTAEQGYVELSQFEAELLLRNGKITEAHEEACFLWVVDDSIKMIREVTRNEERGDPPKVCHTNLTGGGEAFIGGELFFCEDGTILISQKSDRYGWASPRQWRACMKYFRRVFKGTTFIELQPK